MEFLVNHPAQQEGNSLIPPSLQATVCACLVIYTGFNTLQYHLGHRETGELEFIRLGCFPDVRLQSFRSSGESDVSIPCHHDERSANRRLRQFKDQ